MPGLYINLTKYLQPRARHYEIFIVSYSLITPRLKYLEYECTNKR